MAKIIANLKAAGRALMGGGSVKSSEPPVRKSRTGGRFGFGNLFAMYDSAQTNNGNERWWDNADNMGPNRSADPRTRQVLRDRARYEEGNNPSLRGINKTDSNYVVGTGPRLQIKTGNAGLDLQIEKEHRRWFRAIMAARKLRAMIRARRTDGESVAVEFTNERNVLTGKTLVSLDLRLVEADRLADPTGGYNDSKNVDGVKLDENGIPVSYSILDHHPGELYSTYTAKEYSAERVYHLFDLERVERARGISEWASTLRCSSLRRRWQLAIVENLENAANFSLGMKTTLLPEQTEEDGTECGKAAAEVPEDYVMNIERGQIQFYPDGWEAQQLKMDGPGSSYEVFDNSQLNEIARGAGMPFNLAAKNSGGYNYASGNLDFQSYETSINVDRDDLDLMVLNRLLVHFLEELQYIPGFQALRRLNLWAVEYKWLYPGRKHVDPTKVEKGRDLALANGTKSLTEVLGEDGKDFDTHLELLKKERAAMAAAGISPAYLMGATVDEEDDDEPNEPNQPKDFGNGQKE